MSKFYVHDEQSEIPLSAGGAALPSGSTFMQPGVYAVLGKSYDCTRPGLYRWFDPSGVFINRIVSVSPVGGLDIYAAISAISWNHIHGSSTEYGFDGTAMQNMSNVGRYRKWSARCGYMAALGAWLFPQLGVSARVLNVTTVGPLNGYDDGHVIFETLHSGEWRMWDITNGCYFRNASGKHLSTADLIAHIANGSPMPERVRLDYDTKYSHDAVPVGTGLLDMGLYWQRTLETQEQIEAWYRRIFQSIVS